jgi:putative transposase
LALSSWTLDPRCLADPAAAALLDLILELTVLERRLAAHAWVVLPGALHVVAAPSPEALLPWPQALGRVKGLHARCDNRRRGRTGAAWRAGLRIRPLDAEAARLGAHRCERAPVSAGLCRRPEDWPFSTARRRPDAPPWLRPA